ncbi:MAG: hypothetical protein V1844_04590 [Pseudomonadota bacterium]
MIQITAHMRILVATVAVDFRKGIDGFLKLCRTMLAADPFSGASDKKQLLKKAQTNSSIRTPAGNPDRGIKAGAAL